MSYSVTKPQVEPTVGELAAERVRYGLDVTDEDLASVAAQCQSGRNMIRRFVRYANGQASEHHLVTVRGTKLCAVFNGGRVATFLPCDWLPNDRDTAMAMAFREAVR